MRKISIITLVILAVLFVVSLYFYYTLGGFNDPEIKLVNAPSYVVAGKPYEGKMSGKQFGRLFDESEKLIKNKTLNGVVCGVFYNNPEKETDSIKAFVGIILKDSLQNIPAGYTKRNIDARRIIRAKINSHILVAPFIYPDIQETAKNNKVEAVFNNYLEIYSGSKEMIIEVPVR